MDAIVIKNLTKKYKDVVAVDDLSLTIAQGELFALLGLNGAGKTTTIKMLTTLSTPDNGDALINGYSIIKEANKVKEIIGISPQESAVAPALTVKENMEVLCKIYGYPATKTRRKVLELSNIFGLYDNLDKKAGKLSGGYKRRLSIALALIGEPKILFLDEPTLGLDVIARNELWDTIARLKNDMTIVLTTHYIEEAEALSDRMGIMKDGRLLDVDTADNLKAKTNTTKIDDAFVAIVKESKR